MCGFDVVQQPLEVKKRLGYVPETPALYDSLTANQYLELVSCLHHLDRKTAATRRGELLDLFGLASNADQRLSEFSKFAPRSDAYRASWIFFATPADRTRLVRAASTVLVATFLVPYLIAVAAVLMFFSESPLHVLIHLLLIGLLSHLVLQVVTLLEPELPFSRPMTKVRSSTRVFVLMAAMGAGAVLMLVSLGVERLTRTRIEAQAVKLEFEE